MLSLTLEKNVSLIMIKAHTVVSPMAIAAKQIVNERETHVAGVESEPQQHLLNGGVVHEGDGRHKQGRARVEQAACWGRSLRHCRLKVLLGDQAVVEQSHPANTGDTQWVNFILLMHLKGCIFMFSFALMPFKHWLDYFAAVS